MTAKRPPSSAPSTGAAGRAARKTLLVVDDQVVLLDVLGRQFEDDPAFYRVVTASSATDALEKAAELRPDIVMLDIDLGGAASGFDVLRAVRSDRPPSRGGSPRVVMVSMFDNPMYRNRAFELGADAYATKGIRFDTLRALLLDDRDVPVPDEDRGKFWRNAAAVAAGEEASPLPSLSDRERAVVREILSGAYEKEVASRLGISVSSVNTFLRRAMAKLGVATRAELHRLRHPIGS